MPDANPKYAKLPRPESIDQFVQYCRVKPRVRLVAPLDTQLFGIDREGMADLFVHVTNIYIVSEADVYEIKANEARVNCIVTLSAWNSYTPQAKETARLLHIGLFTFSEFMGAIYYDGDKFLDYLPPEKRN